MKNILLFLFIFSPVLASAYAFPDLRTFAKDLVEVLNIVLNIATALAFIAFFWGVAKFILASGDAKAITDGKEFMIYAILALFILVSVNGILIFTRDQFGFGSTLPDTENFLPSERADSTVIFQ